MPGKRRCFNCLDVPDRENSLLLMMNCRILLCAAMVATGQLLHAQTNTASSSVSTAPTVNGSIVATQHTVDRAKKRTEFLLQRAKENQGKCDIVFLGDSITERWETDGTNAWNHYYGDRKVLNLGVGGDRTQHMLWRLEQGQLDGLEPKVLVFLLGTNNANDRPEDEIVASLKTVLGKVRKRLPKTKILLMGIFPRGQTFNPIRGKVLQVNQALAQLEDGQHLFFMDIGARFVGGDGSISKTVMKDYVHLSARGYEIWAEAIEPKLRELLGEK